MPHVHHAVFRVRHYECDGHGTVHYANYLRYMQEAAFAASEAVGYGEAVYTALGYQWLAYGTNIAYFAPLRYGEDFTVKTWVHDFRRVRSLRNYEFYRDGALVAQAATDWVFINLKSQRPATVPPEIVAAYAQGDPVPPVPRRDPLPRVGEPSRGVFTLRRRVQWRDIDPAGHVNNAIYLHYAEDCGGQVRREHGWPVPRLEEMGVGIVVDRHQVEYKLPAVMDDELDIVTWMAHAQPTSVLRHYLIKRAPDGQILTQVRAVYQWVDVETGDPVPVPQTYLDDLAENIVG